MKRASLNVLLKSPFTYYQSIRRLKWSFWLFLQNNLKLITLGSLFVYLEVKNFKMHLIEISVEYYSTTLRNAEFIYFGCSLFKLF
jgi:hypothetical protein